MARYTQRNTTWSLIYDQLYARGTVYANHGNLHDTNESPDRPYRDDVPEDTPLPLDLTGTKLAEEYGRVILERCIWGASYSSYLFEYRQHLEWTISDDNDPKGSIQWIELL